MKWERRRWILPAIATATLLVLLAIPQTGWIIRTHALHVVRYSGDLWGLDRLAIKLQGRERVETEGKRQSALIPLSSANSSYSLNSAKSLASARLAVRRAIQAERSGHANDGVRIRRRLMQWGGSMRAQSRSARGAMVGVEITNIAMIQPGGAPAIPGDSDEASQQRLAAYCRFLTHTGHKQDIPAVETEAANGEVARSIVLRVQGIDTWALSPAWDHLTKLWIAGWILSVNIAWLIVLGLIGALIANRLTMDDHTPPRNPISKIAWKCAAILALSLTLWLMLAIQAKSLAASANYISWYDREAARINGSEGSMIARILVLTAAPILLAAFCLIAGVAQRPSTPRTFAQHMGRLAWPIASILILLYGAVILETSHEERLRNMEAREITQNECAYYARWEHRKWPGMTVWR
ncbi:hypothetical protein CCAX7_008790 [Capsulimonas corticalis]|uniref:Uncharacterized protein n=1 Tax=Capsulimonas corticalis TaxID=2219043 RepID=A0A402CU37_9BACT|nr:hypothetical protein [Capsulimonas corticalis]BDI28828.1 hypothetical protein CCAX7_008790 [Capsulimonas corticalis]